MATNEFAPLDDRESVKDDAGSASNGKIRLSFSALNPAALVRKGDQHQEDTLRILEENIGIMEDSVHSKLHQKYDGLRLTRASMGKYGLMTSLFDRSKVVAYKKDAKGLNTDTVQSSQDARSNAMWKQKESGAVSPDSHGTPHTNEDAHGRIVSNETPIESNTSTSECRKGARPEGPVCSHLVNIQEHTEDDPSDSSCPPSDQHAPLEVYDALQTEDFHEPYNGGYGFRG
ncbi:hypothetical protein SCP_0302720 [Sparassis crispa]|uniref:Uncharacterized protein n=1 Tax=Sparassis crispa TaxID=139825 RepID=A0A401GEG9_9APHY|nr:hypothetical protein SCP_0302720 [Sparassis crispa]GBE80557.1 hypothetical protein SCP_0302720 [Sparassis crispa]